MIDYGIYMSNMVGISRGWKWKGFPVLLNKEANRKPSTFTYQIVLRLHKQLLTTFLHLIFIEFIILFILYKNVLSKPYC